MILVLVILRVLRLLLCWCYSGLSIRSLVDPCPPPHRVFASPMKRARRFGLKLMFNINFVFYELYGEKAIADLASDAKMRSGDAAVGFLERM